MSTYTNMNMKAAGALVFQNQDFDIDWPESDQPVTTIPGGNVGTKRGVMTCIITITNAVPYKKDAIDWLKARRDGTEVPIQAWQTGSTKRVADDFIVTSYKLTQSGPNEEPRESVTLRNARSPAPIFE